MTTFFACLLLISPLMPLLPTVETSTPSKEIKAHSTVAAFDAPPRPYPPLIRR
jgi:hypothetical protein